MWYIIDFNDHDHNGHLFLRVISTYKLNNMGTLNYNINLIKIEKQLAWVMTIALLVLSFPFFKNTFVFALDKLYELFILQGILK